VALQRELRAFDEQKERGVWTTNRAIENLVQELAGRMTYPEAKRAVRESLMRGIIRNLPQPWPLSMPAAKPNLAQPIDESGFSAGFEVGD